jgi:uncharacterized repeat protein (TIGR02543 family)
MHFILSKRVMLYIYRYDFFQLKTFCFGGNMRFPVKIISILMILTAAIAVIACTNSMTPSSDTPATPTPTYTVTFSSQFNNTQDTTTMPDPISKTVTPPATTIDKEPKPPTMSGSGYKFYGWFTEKNGNGVHFTASTQVTRDIIVYAYWYKYKITFMSEGATVAIRMITTPTAEELPAPPIRTGYTFAGWNTAANGTGTEFIANTPVTADITVYAKWTADTNTVRTVTYDSNGGTAVGVQYVVSPATKVVTLPDPPTQLFHNFNGWFTAASGGTAFTETTPVTTNITVYAQWTATPGYTIIYNSQGGTAVDPKYVILPATTVGTLPADPTKPCYTFDTAAGTTTGWWTAPNGGGTEFKADTDVTSIADPTTKILTVYAKWTYVGFTPSYPAPSTYTIGGPGQSCVGKVFYIEGGGTSGLHGLEAAPPDWYLSVDPLSTGDPSSVWIDGGYEVIEEETCEGETGDTCKSINNDRCKDGTCVLIDNIVDHVLNRKVVDYHKTQTTLNGNTKTAIGTGSANTDFIIAQSADAQAADKVQVANAQAAGIVLTLLPLEKYAAKLCRDYRGGGLDKWFLPSKDELAQLYAHRDETRWGGFTEGCYWSSSEYDLYVAAWSQYFTNGTQPGSPKVVERLVRPVRAF